MLTIEAYIDVSKIQGIGLFAATKIHKGQLVWQYNSLIDITYTQAQWDNLKESMAPSAFERIDKYSFTLDGNFIVEVDGGQFVNHSAKQFNIASQAADSKKAFATRDILVNEEILANYLSFCEPDELSF